MRIAFVGKGGSGKTTISSLYALYSDSMHRRVGLIDVDVNSHTAEVLGARQQDINELSNESSQAAIQEYLAGSNERIHSEEFLNTTPPGSGSHYWTLDPDNYITQTYGYRFGSSGTVLTLGSYSDVSIGADCHHTTQHVAENILSHTKTNGDDTIIVDSVAGNDTFANSLYLQDVLLFVMKPEREGLKVFERYYDLATRAGVGERVFVIGNNVSSQMQRAFIQKNLPDGVLIGTIAADEAIIEQRLQDMPLTIDCLSPEMKSVFAVLDQKLTSLAKSPRLQYDDLVSLHRTVSAQPWVAGSYRAGLSDQIDPHYKPASA